MKPGLSLFAGVVISVVIAIALTTVGSALWQATSTPVVSTGASAGTTLPSGNQPTATNTLGTESVDVAWEPSTGGAPVEGYEIRAYDATKGEPRTVGGTCAGLVVGRGCTDADVPDGSWTYSVVPHQQLWTGAESKASDAVTVDSSYRALVVGDGPAAYWRLGESSGTNAVDEMGASNGTYAGGYTLGASGALANNSNTAVELNGTGGRVSAPSLPALNLTSQVSIEAWVNPDSLAGTRWIVNKGTFYYLYIDNGTTYFGIHNGTYTYLTTTTVTTGAWQHLVGTYDGSSLVLYRNGVVVAQAPASGAISSTTEPLFIGAFSTGGSFFDGRIDETAVYGSGLTAAQALAHYQRGNSTRPAVTVTFPAFGGIYSATSWNGGCTSQICGTAVDTGGGVASVAVSVRQGSGNYWDGSGFASATEVLVPATGTTSWTLAFAARNFTADGAYTVRAVADDGAGNRGVATATFTIDKTNPTVAITFPSAAGSYGIASWNAGCTSRICGTASDTGGSVASVAVSVRQGSGNYWNGTAFASATEVLLAATGTTSWTRAFPASNFPADGSYTVRAVATDTAGNTAAAFVTFTMDVTSPAPTALALFDGDGFVTPETDEVRITFSEPLKLSTVCSTWAGTGDQSLGGSGTVVTITENGANDTVTVAASGCTLRVGSVASGGDYVTATATFSGSTVAAESRVTWTAATRVLTIHLGSLATGTLNDKVQQPEGTATYTPNAAITDVAGNPVTTTPFSASKQRF